MDEMKIGSIFMRTVISKIARKLIKKKFGYDLDIQINGLAVTVNNGKSHVHLDVDAELEKDELIKILKTIGLN